MALVAIVLGLSGCAAPPATPVAADGPNVLLISIDTLRPDHLGCYGYGPPTSPALDAFRDDAVLFTTAIAQAPSTLHSHASILTSMLPHHHGAGWGGKTRLDESAVTVTEVLRDAGYATAAFTGPGQMDPIFGLDQGFDLYEKVGGQSFHLTSLRGLEWIDEHSAREEERPFFLFLHTYETHHPYSPPADLLALFDGDYAGPLPPSIDLDILRAINRGDLEISDADLDHIVATYDAEIRSMDTALGDLLTALRERGLYDDTLIVFTSDHGEEFGEHGVVGWHSHTLYDELLRIPLLIKYPGGKHAGATVEGQVRSLDVAPSILAAAAIEPPDRFAGVDLAPLAAAGATTTELAAVSRIDRVWSRDLTSIRTERWKLMPPPKTQRGQSKSLWLFDLEADPGEQWDTASSHLAVKTELEEALAAAVASRKRLQGEQVAPTKTTLDDLRKLGYIE